MSCHGVVLVVSTYSAAMSACEKGHRSLRAFELLKRCKAMASCLMCSSVLDVITHSAAMSACEMCHRPSQAFELLQALQSHGVVFDGITHSVAMRACEKDQWPQLAFGLLQRCEAMASCVMSSSTARP